MYACTNNGKKSATQTVEKNENTIPVTWIEVPDSLSNFGALEATRHLYYLEEMVPASRDFNSDFWKKMDTLQNNDWFYTTLRQGACNTTFKDSIGETRLLCVETRKHIVNKSLEKVIQFSGTGSGYFATIEFVYDDDGKLLEYKDFGDVFYFKYNEKNLLNEVLHTETLHGIKRVKQRFKFKKIASENRVTKLENTVYTK
jgi:hypothetical protein